MASYNNHKQPCSSKVPVIKILQPNNQALLQPGPVRTNNIWLKNEQRYIGIMRAGYDALMLSFVQPTVVSWSLIPNKALMDAQSSMLMQENDLYAAALRQVAIFKHGLCCQTPLKYSPFSMLLRG